MTPVLQDELHDAQFLRALAYIRSGGAEIGECVETARVGGGPSAVSPTASTP